MIDKKASPAFIFVLTTGIVNLFSDMTYEGGASIKHVALPPSEVGKFRLLPGDLLACRFNSASDRSYVRYDGGKHWVKRREA